MYLVYSTSECDKRAKQLGATALRWLENQKKKIKESGEGLAGAHSAPPYKYFSHVGDERCVVKEYDLTVDGVAHKVAVIFDIRRRVEKEWLTFKGDPESYGREKYEPVFGKERAKIEERIRGVSSLPAKQASMLSKDEIDFLTIPVGESSSDGAGDNFEVSLVYESRRWTEYVRGIEHVAWLPRLRDAIVEVGSVGSTGNEDGIELSYGIREHEHYYIAYQWLDHGRSLFLYDVYYDDGGENRTKPEGAVPLDKLHESDKPFFRTYPYYMLADENLWIEMERDPMGNFSLSDEEARILRPPKGAPIQFPLFINGRAGSGKSTVLQYLYARYFARWARGADQLQGNPPVYFACNSELVDRARKFVASILTKNPDYEGNPSIGKYVRAKYNESEVECEPAFVESFQEFRQFLLSLIPEETRNSKFPAEKYVSYTRFVREWRLHFDYIKQAREKYGPAASWHVIRTFIKGRSADKYIGVEDYEKLEPELRSVSIEDFKSIYENVWKKWYIPERSRFWDDQDLVRYVIKNGLLSRKVGFYGVFCDEAQDFTKLEFDVIFEVSRFTGRQIYPHLLPRVPVAFAADESQTLNPTGFRWSAVVGYFREQNRQNANGAKALDLNPRDLIKNYRSQANIVKVCNSIQLLRAAKFKLSGVKPQEEWQWYDDAIQRVSWYSANDTVFWHSIRNLQDQEDVCIIVPCHRGEEYAYAKEHLAGRVTIDEDTGTMTPPVMSAVQAKGLDFTCVVVYGFGDYLASVFGAGAVESASSYGIESRIAIEYFMSRLYVAVSRPRRQLYIVDTEWGCEQLWNMIADKKSLAQLISQHGMDSEWALRCGGWFKGDHGKDIELDYLGVNFAELAKRIWRSAHEDHDPELARYAAYYFEKQAGGIPEARKCRAWAEVYEAELCGRDEKGRESRRKKLRVAVSLFTDNGNVKETSDCLWSLGGDDDFSEMVSLAAKYPTLCEGVRFDIARAFVCRDEDSIIYAFSSVADFIEAGRSQDLTTEAWRMAIVRLMGLAEALPASTIEKIAGNAYAVVSAGLFDEKRKNLTCERLGDFECSRKNYVAAAVFYKAANIGKSGKYNRAKFFGESYPANLLYIDSASEIDICTCAVEEFAAQEATRNDLKPAEQRGVVLAYARLGRLCEVSVLLRKMLDATFFEDVLRPLQSTSKQCSARLHEAAVIISVMHKKQGEAINYLFGGDRFQKEDGDRLADVFLVQVLARLADAPAGTIKPTTKASAVLNEFVRKVINDSRALRLDELGRVVYKFDLEKEMYKKRRLDKFGFEPTDIERNRFSWQSLLDEVLSERSLTQDDSGGADDELWRMKDRRSVIANGERDGSANLNQERQERKASVAGRLSYNPRSGKLKIGDEFFADSEGIFVTRDMEPLGQEIKLSDTIVVKVRDRNIVVTDSSTGFCLELKTQKQ